jgi:hypothetical protein
MIVEVELHAFHGRGHSEVRQVDVPDDATLEDVFYWGQNDFQPKPQRSVSVGDIIRWTNGRYLVVPTGFERLAEGVALPPDPLGLLAYRLSPEPDKTNSAP